MINLKQVKVRVADASATRAVYSALLAWRGRWEFNRNRSRAAEYLLRAWRAKGPAFSGAALVHRIIRDSCYELGELQPISRNLLLADFVSSPEAAAIRDQFHNFPIDDRVRLRFPRDDSDPERQGDLIVLKPFDSETGEKGVLLITYTEAIRRFAALFDMSAVSQRYMIVLEPSWWGYQDTSFLFYIGSDVDVLIESPWRADFDYLNNLGTNLTATRLGAGDWVDPEVFRPAEDAERSYDLAMVSSWSPVKRHEELFRTLAQLRARGRKLSVVLVGYPAIWTRERIESMIEQYGLKGSCDVFERIPHEQVATLVSKARAFVLLSRREGANRSIYEALFCNTPIVVYKHHRGVNTDHVTPEVGVLFEDGKLDVALEQVLDPAQSFHPREWALRNTGFANATLRLNDQLRGLASKRGLPWTIDAVAKRMAPNLRYTEPGLYRAFDNEYNSLKQLLRRY